MLQYIAKFNGVPCNITLETFSSITDDDSSIDRSDSSPKGTIVLGSGDKTQSLSLLQKLKLELLRLRVLFGTFQIKCKVQKVLPPIDGDHISHFTPYIDITSTFPMAWLTICIWVIYMWDYWGFTIAGAYLALILQRKSAELGLGLKSTYLSYIYIYIFGFPGVLAGTTIYKWRQISMLISSALFAAMLFTFTVVDDQASYIGINGLVYFFQSMFNAILYGSTPESFPAPVRGMRDSLLPSYLMLIHVRYCEWSGIFLGSYFLNYCTLGSRRRAAAQHKRRTVPCRWRCIRGHPLHLLAAKTVYRWPKLLSDRPVTRTPLSTCTEMSCGIWKGQNASVATHIQSVIGSNPAKSRSPQIDPSLALVCFTLPNDIQYLSGT